MRRIPNYYENQLHFYPYLEACHQFREYIKHGANITHPGPFSALEDQLRFLSKNIAQNFLNMFQDYKAGDIEHELYKKYLLMYQQRLLTVGAFYSTVELNQSFMNEQIKLHLQPIEKLKSKKINK